MDSVMHNALKRREELQRELRDVDRFLALYERFRGASSQGSLPGLRENEDVEQTSNESGFDPAQSAVMTVMKERALGRLNRIEMRPHITAVLEDAKRPLTRGLLLRKLEQRGVEVGGSYDKSKNMGTIMWRLRDDFINLAGEGYWPRHLPYEPAGYDPEGDAPATVEPDFTDIQN